MLSSGRDLATCTHQNRNARPKTLAPVFRPIRPGGLVTIGRKIPPSYPMSIFFFSGFMMVVPVSRQANRPTLYPMGLQTRTGQYQTDRGDILLGYDGGIFRGVWVVRLLGSDLDLVPFPAVLTELVTWRDWRRLGVLGWGFK